MVAVFNKEHLSWYIITLKLKETLESRITINREEDDGQTLQEQEEASKSPDTEWIISMKDKLDRARQDNAARSWSNLSIYRIPHYRRESGGDDKAFVPQIVSLGPYHHGKQRLRQMDRHKWRSLHHVLKRNNHEIKLYIDSMKKMEERARSCYEGSIGLSSNEFVEMLVLDGCFVLELFRGAKIGFEELGYSRDDPIFAMRGSMYWIPRDMIMLENQIPWFVLDRLLGIQLGDPKKRLDANLALRFFYPLRPTDEPLTKSDRNKLESSPGSSTSQTTMSFDPLSDVFRRSTSQSDLHCLDVFRRSLLRSRPEPEAPRIWSSLSRRVSKMLTAFKTRVLRSHTRRDADKRRQEFIHCVTELKDAGIKFKKRKTDRFWDIKFKNGILRMPRLFIHDDTKSLFLNLIAFEQSHLDCSKEITSYVIFMDNLINSSADVMYLHYCGIIEHWLGSDGEVADLFNRLCQEVAFDINDSYLSPVSEAVNRYYDHRWNAWRASLKHNYFSNPWAIISLVAAVVLLLLTFAQTYYTIYGYYRPVG